jgi:hypothetical protein
MGDIMTLHNIARVPVMVCFLLSAMTIQAAPVKWEISGLTFADGGSGSGYFVFDADTAAVSDWEIDVAGGTTTDLPAIQYNVNNSSSDARASDFSDELMIVFDINIGLRQLRITPFSSLTNSGGSIAIDTQTLLNGSGSVECISCAPFRIITGGTLTAPPPEPTLQLILESPAESDTYSGVSTLRGWAVAEEGISKVDIYIDGNFFQSAPYGGSRGDVGSIFPDINNSGESGFALAFNFSDLSEGTHTIRVEAVTNSSGFGDSESRSLSRTSQFQVTKFPSPFLPADQSPDLSGASCVISEQTVHILDTLVDGSIYDVSLQWRTADQGFQIQEIR